MIKAKNISLVISALLLLTFAITYLYPKENIDLVTWNYLTLINSVAFFGFITALYIAILAYDIDSGKLRLSKILFYGLLLLSIGILVYFCFRSAAVSAFIFAAAVVHFLIMYFVQKYFLRDSALSLRKEFLALPVFVAVIVLLTFFPIKKICS